MGGWASVLTGGVWIKEHTKRGGPEKMNRSRRCVQKKKVHTSEAIRFIFSLGTGNLQMHAECKSTANMSKIKLSHA